MLGMLKTHSLTIICPGQQYAEEQALCRHAQNMFVVSSDWHSYLKHPEKNKNSNLDIE